jgi:geranylgeranyl pyrophosphate synthase
VTVSNEILQASGIPAEANSVVDLLIQELETRWQADAERLPRISRYALLPAGKLLRPLLVLESARAVGSEVGELLGAALGVEYLHVGSLIHDDLIDGDETRRGRPSVPHRFGAADAIVTGDALILEMFTAVTECADRGVPPDRVVAAVRALARAGVDLCRGQTMEAELCGDLSCGLDAYLAMIGLKTGALFRGACQTGVILGGGTAPQEQAITGYAEHLGLAFQMHDDLLPHLSDTAATGKSSLSDVANARPTFPILLGYRMAGTRDRRRLELALSGDLSPSESMEVAGTALTATGALDAAREQAAAQAALAKERLGELPSTAASAVLAAVADRAVDRDR